MIKGKLFGFSLLLLLLSTPPLFADTLPVHQKDRAPILKQLDLFVDVINYIRSDYVEEVPVKKLIDGALSGMLRSLDPYSQFLNAKAYQDLKVDTDGKFAGLGLEVSLKSGLFLSLCLGDQVIRRLRLVNSRFTLFLEGNQAFSGELSRNPVNVGTFDFSGLS